MSRNIPDILYTCSCVHIVNVYTIMYNIDISLFSNCCILTWSNLFKVVFKYKYVCVCVYLFAYKEMIRCRHY